MDIYPPSTPLTGGDEGLNAHHLFCPREACRSKILQAGTANLVETEVGKIPKLTSPTGGKVWEVYDVMTFYNIGVSRPAVGQLEGADSRYLACADCDHGPLGWHNPEERDGEGRKVWRIAAECVRYQKV